MIHVSVCVHRLRQPFKRSSTIIFVILNLRDDSIYLKVVQGDLSINTIQAIVPYSITCFFASVPRHGKEAACKCSKSMLRLNNLIEMKLFSFIFARYKMNVIRFLDVRRKKSELKISIRRLTDK